MSVLLIYVAFGLFSQISAMGHKINQ